MATSPIGAPGALFVAVCDDVVGVADVSGDGLLGPTEFIAETLYT